GDSAAVRASARVRRARAVSAARAWDLTGDPARVGAAAANASHAEAIAVAARAAAADALIAARLADPETVAAQRRSWYAGQEEVLPLPARRRGGPAGAARPR